MDPLLQVKDPFKIQANAQVQPMQQIPNTQVTQAITPNVQTNLGYDPKFDYKAQINQLSTVNPNDPQIQVLQGQRDLKLTALYGNDFQKRINELSAINPNNPDIADLTRLREAKIKQQQATQPQEVTPSTPPEGTPITEYTNDQLLNQGMAQFQEAQQNKESILKTIVNTPFTDNYVEQKKQYLASINKPFEYNAETDMALQQAKKRTTNTVMAEMNKRGFLSNSMTQEELINAYSSLETQFRSLAFDEYNKNISNAIQGFNLLQGLTEFDYTQYRNWIDDNIQYANENVDIAYKNLQEFKNVIDINNQEEANKIEAYNSQVTKQAQRVKMLGYVDNEASIYLGLPVGTLSEEAQKQAYELKSYAAKQKLDLEYSQKKLDQEHKYTVAEMQTKLQNEKELAAINYGYDAKKLNISAANSRSNAAYSASLQKDVAAYKSTLDKKADTKTVSNYNNFLKQGLEMYTQTYSEKVDGETVTKKRYTPEAIKNWIVGLKISDDPTENAELILALINSVISEDDLEALKHKDDMNPQETLNLYEQRRSNSIRNKITK